MCPGWELSTGTMARHGRMPCRGEAGVSSRCGSGRVSRNLRRSEEQQQHLLRSLLGSSGLFQVLLSALLGLVHLYRKSTPLVNNAALPQHAGASGPVDLCMNGSAKEGGNTQEQC